MFDKWYRIKKKRQKKISPNSGHSRGGGGQDGKWSHFTPVFFLTLPCVCKTEYKVIVFSFKK